VFSVDQADARSGLAGLAARMVASLSASMSSDGASRTMSKNARPGNGRANWVMKSQWPSSMNSSINRVTRSRVADSYRATALGVKYALMTCR
jgi:hypothetical protein